MMVSAWSDCKYCQGFIYGTITKSEIGINSLHESNSCENKYDDMCIIGDY